MRQRSLLLIGGCGYIGSALFRYLRQRQWHVETIDLEWFGNPLMPDNRRVDYRDLQSRELARFDAVILLAGHSSVKMCSGDPLASINNNVTNLVGLLGKLRQGARFVYASSSSVYGNLGDFLATEATTAFRPGNHYDLSKYAADCYAQLNGDIDFYGLRFGTVNGPSPNLRTDLMLNAMFYNARTHGHIALFNEWITRPILGIQDLCRAMEAILESSQDARGIYNLASFSGTSAAIAERASAILGVPVRRQSSAELGGEKAPRTYDFDIDSSKFRKTFGFDFLDSIESILDGLKQESPFVCVGDRTQSRGYV